VRGAKAAGVAFVKVLYISDSLGTPIHPRGIFNFSVSLVEILKSEGAQVDLVVEGAPDFSLEDRFGAFAETAPEAVNSVRLSEVHRYFNQGQLSFRWGYRTPRIRFWAKRSRPLIASWLAFRERMGYRPNIAVRNDPAQIDFVPPKSEHLMLFDHFVVKRGFYSSSMSRANLGLPPPVIDASGYDLAIVDTPHFIRIEGLGPKRIMTVVHDLIPLRDPTMDLNWRNLFMRKLDATLAMRGAMIFVSRYTQRAFHAAFPNHNAPSEFIVHPAIRHKLMKEAEQARQAGAELLGDFSPPIGDTWTEAQDTPANSKKKKKKRTAPTESSPPPGYDPTLPYFVTATSDDPRKNISVAARAFYQYLHGRANIVILGQINPRKYAPDRSTNVYFAGYVSDARKTAYFRDARGVVFASLSEGFGIPIVEGAVMGLPVLCSDIEVFREVAGEGAFYFDPREPLSLARAVLEALTDPQAAKARAEALRESVLARFSQETVGASLRAALDALGLSLRP
jgi:glycosyltransferase involved in cell wall biosynthesis